MTLDHLQRLIGRLKGVLWPRERGTSKRQPVIYELIRKHLRILAEKLVWKFVNKNA